MLSKDGATQNTSIFTSSGETASAIAATIIRKGRLQTVNQQASLERFPKVKSKISMGAQQFQYPQRPAAKQPRRQILDPSKALPYRGGQVIQRSLTRKFAHPIAASGKGAKVGPGGKLLAPRPQSAAGQ